MREHAADETPEAGDCGCHAFPGAAIALPEDADGTVTYTAFDAASYELNYWLGAEVALLVPEQAVVDDAVMAKLLSAFDAGYAYYAGITGREPNAASTISGRATIAIVPATCGAGCGFLGATGIEILPDWFGAGLTGSFPWIDGFYDTMAANESMDSIVFYELGRNFWFYFDKLGDFGFTTGYAVINRYFAGLSSGYALDATSIAYHNDRLPVIALTYFEDADATGANTLGLGLGIDNPTPHDGAADLAAALFRLLHEHAGRSGYETFWQTLPTLPNQGSASEAFDNFVAAALAATSQDYSFLFKTGHSFLVGDVAANALAASAASVLLGFQGADTLTGSAADDSLFGDTGDDRLLGGAGIDDLAGGSGDDVLIGGGGGDVLNGAEGADALDGGFGADTMIGGWGNDTYTVNEAGDVAIERAGQGADTARAAISFVLPNNIDYLVLLGALAINGNGNAGANKLTGNSTKNALKGLAGNDSISGGGGNDVITGGLGVDLLKGDSGADSFVFDVAPGAANADTILAFSVADDTIRLENAIYAALGATGVLAASAFASGPGGGAQTAATRIIHNSSNGKLFYDADGAGGAAPLHFATVGAGLALTNADFLVI